MLFLLTIGSASLRYCHQGGQSDSGMGLSSDNMQTLRRLESLAGRPLSIMALAYVHLHTSASAARTDEQTAQHTLG